MCPEDWSLEDFRASTKRGAGGASRFGVVGAIFVECFNEGPLEEAQWVPWSGVEVCGVMLGRGRGGVDNAV